MMPFINAHGQPMADDLVRQIEYAAEVPGGIAAPREEGYIVVKDLNTLDRLDRIADRLLARGHSEARVEKIVGSNSLRLFHDVWGDVGR